MKRLLIFIPLLLTLAGCEKGGGEEETPNYSLLNVGDDIPVFSPLTPVAGAVGVFDPQALGGKRTLIYFLRSDCPACHSQTPAVLTLWDEVRDDNSVRVVCIARGDNPPAEARTEQKAIDYWAEAAGQFGIGVDEMPSLCYDDWRVVFDLFATQNVPRFYVISPAGKVEWESEGILDHQTLRDRIM